jgi:hypothetical protein
VFTLYYCWCNGMLTCVDECLVWRIEINIQQKIVRQVSYLEGSNRDQQLS